jgi:hypothetical protein
MPTYFHFGEETDLVFVLCRDAAKAANVLGSPPLPGVIVHTPR